MPLDDLKNQSKESGEVFNLEDVKKRLFSAGQDYVKWGYNEHYDGTREKTAKKDKLIERIIKAIKRTMIGAR